MKFKCGCGFHIIDINITPIKGEDFVGIVIYNHKSEDTGKIYKKPKEMGTVVMIGKEAKKFKKYLNKKNKINKIYNIDRLLIKNIRTQHGKTLLGFFLLASFGLNSLGYVSQAGIVQDFSDCIADVSHHHPQPAGLFIRAITRLIRHLAYTADGSQWSIQHAHDMPEIDFGRWFGQVITSAEPHFALQQAGVLELEQDLSEELGRDICALGNILDLHDRIGLVRIGAFCHVHHGTQSIFTTLGEPHCIPL